MKIITYEAKKAWAGAVWIWGRTLNEMHDDENLKVIYQDKSKIYSKQEIRKLVDEKKIRTKITFNPLLNKEGTQYAFDIKDLT